MVEGNQTLLETSLDVDVMGGNLKDRSRDPRCPPEAKGNVDSRDCRFNVCLYDLFLLCQDPIEVGSHCFSPQIDLGSHRWVHDSQHLLEGWVLEDVEPVGGSQFKLEAKTLKLAVNCCRWRRQ
jgi:hypothetical protein